jgi:hypothetical protein
VVNSMIVISILVRFWDNVANGDCGPSSSANSCIFQGDILVIAHSVQVRTAVRADNESQITIACSGLIAGEDKEVT